MQKNELPIRRRTAVRVPNIVLTETTMRITQDNQKIIESMFKQESPSELVAKAKKDKAKEIAYRLLEVMPDEDIAEFTGLLSSEIYQIRKDSGL